MGPHDVRILRRNHEVVTRDRVVVTPELWIQADIDPPLTTGLVAERVVMNGGFRQVADEKGVRTYERMKAMLDHEEARAIARRITFPHRLTATDTFVAAVVADVEMDPAVLRTAFEPIAALVPVLQRLDAEAPPPPDWFMQPIWGPLAPQLGLVCDGPREVMHGPWKIASPDYRAPQRVFEVELRPLQRSVESWATWLRVRLERPIALRGRLTRWGATLRYVEDDKPRPLPSPYDTPAVASAIATLASLPVVTTVELKHDHVRVIADAMLTTPTGGRALLDATCRLALAMWGE